MNISPKKSLGQNFLINPHIIDKIVSAGEISKNDTVLEVGPGTGLLTKKLSEKAGRVIAIEKDHRLVASLKELFKNKNVEIIEGDILNLPPEALDLGSNYKIIANIPYYITSHLLRKIFEEFPRPKLIVLTIQKEVAKRIIAQPPHTNLLALSVQYYSEPEIIGYISKNNFKPVPKVDSAIIKLKPKSEIRNSKQTEEIFKIIKIGFSEKRKQLASILSKKLKLDKEKILDAFQKEGIAPNVRAENLSLDKWQGLQKNLNT